MKRRCADCSTEVPAGANFCGTCGAAMVAHCEMCGTPVAAPGQAFCLECGGGLGESRALQAGMPAASTARESPPPQRPAAGIERRLVTVLFADLTDFTAFSEQRDHEDVREILSHYFAAARRIVESYGGMVGKFIGDAVMAVWGAPVAHEDDAERAVRAALDLVAAVSGLGDRLGVELCLRCGVLTGEAAVEVEAVAEGMVVGDTVNTASRIQQLAPPGSVLVDDVTRRVTECAIAYADGGTHPVKGKSQPLRTWRALRVVAAVGGAGRSGIEVPLVGRTRELGVIRSALEDVLRPGAGLRMVCVVGEAGLGKSRLAWELEKYLDGLSAEVLWHRGQALSFGEGVGFWALADMVRMRAKITRGEPASAQQRKLDALLCDLFDRDPDARERVARALRRLLGLDDGRELIDRGELFASWRLLFERLAVSAPVVLLFEDLHWADQGLFDFIEHMGEWAAAAAILVLVCSRPDKRLDPLMALGERVSLTPLSGEEIEQLVRAAVDGGPSRLSSRVRELAGGVPLFAVESLRMLADRGLALSEQQRDGYRIAGDVEDLDVPPSIHALVAARLDGLGTLERRVLLDAAVLGEGFTAAAVAAVAGVGEPEVRFVADGLVGKQFLAVVSDPRSPERGQYAFVHGLVQRVARGTLSKHERKACHLAAVEHLSGGEPDADLAAILAGHLLAAVDADPVAPDAPQIRHQALGMTLAAAERATSVGASAQAIALFDRAAEIEPDELQRAEHLTRAARHAERFGGPGVAAAERYAAARALYERNGCARDGLRLRARELHAYRWTRPAAELLAPMRDVYDALRGVPDDLFSDAAAVLASVLYLAGDAQAAERIGAEAALAAQRSEAWHALGLALVARAGALLELGRPVQALTVFRQALAFFEQREPAEAPVVLCNIAITLGALGRFEEAAAMARRAMAAAERVANRFSHYLAGLQLARALFSLGRWDDALAVAKHAAAQAAPTFAGMGIGPPLLVACYRGQPDAARAVIAGFDERQAQSRSAFEADYRCLREVALAHLDGDPARAASTVVSAQTADYAEWPAWLALAADLLVQSPDPEPLGAALAALAGPVAPRTSPIVVVQAERLAAHRAARAGDEPQAAAHWHVAREIALGAGMAFDAAVMALELAEHQARENGSVTEPAEAAEAAATFDRLGAGWWARRARAIAYAEMSR